MYKPRNPLSFAQVQLSESHQLAPKFGSKSVLTQSKRILNDLPFVLAHLVAHCRFFPNVFLQLGIQPLDISTSIVPRPRLLLWAECECMANLQN